MVTQSTHLLKDCYPQPVLNTHHSEIRPLKELDYWCMPVHSASNNVSNKVFKTFFTIWKFVRYEYLLISSSFILIVYLDLWNTVFLTSIAWKFKIALLVCYTMHKKIGFYSVIFISFSSLDKSLYFYGAFSCNLYIIFPFFFTFLMVAVFYSFLQSFFIYIIIIGVIIHLSQVDKETINFLYFYIDSVFFLLNQSFSLYI